MAAVSKTVTHRPDKHGDNVWFYLIATNRAARAALLNSKGKHDKRLIKTSQSLVKAEGLGWLAIPLENWQSKDSDNDPCNVLTFGKDGAR